MEGGVRRPPRHAARVPYPGAQTAPVHEKDIAALAVTALTEEGHSHQAYTVYGPRSLTLRQQVAQIGDAIGREVSLEVITAGQARLELAARMSPAGANAVLGAWEAGNDGPAPISVIVERITGRPGRTFSKWAAEHADDFR